METVRMAETVVGAVEGPVVAAVGIVDAAGVVEGLAAAVGIVADAAARVGEDTRSFFLRVCTNKNRTASEKATIASWPFLRGAASS
jgi:hypothetical protein